MSVFTGVRTALLLAALLAVPPVEAREQATTLLPSGGRILVMPFAVDVEAGAPGEAGASLWLGEAAAVLLTDGLAARGLGALPREERTLAFHRLQLPMSPTLTRATMIRVGELLGASELVFGEVRMGDRLSVRARLVRLAEASESPAIEAEAELGELFPLFERVADRLARETGRPLAFEPVAPAPLALEVFENYVKGLVASTLPAQQRFLEAAMVEAPSDGRILTALWRVYSALGQHERALEAASAVPADSPQGRAARFAVALSLVELDRLDGAARQLGELQAELPAPGVANALGIVELRRDVPPEQMRAAAYIAGAVEDEPTNTDYLFNLGYAYARQGDVERALHWLREAVRHDAANADSHLVMAAVLVASGRAAEARREHDLALLLGAIAGPVPAATVPEGLERLPPVIDIDYAPRTALLVANPGQRDQQVTAAYHLDQGRRLIEAHRDREAIDELRRAIYLAPYEDEPHLLLGRAYQRAGRLDEAIDEFKVALWSRETVDARLALGAALLEAGDRDGARREAQRALQLDPQSLEARELLDRIGG